MNTIASNLAKAIKTAATAVAYERSAKWTGAAAIRTISAEELDGDQDMEVMYFQIDLDGRGDTMWVSEDGMDELEEGDMRDRIS